MASALYEFGLSPCTDRVVLGVPGLKCIGMLGRYNTMTEMANWNSEATLPLAIDELQRTHDALSVIQEQVYSSSVIDQAVKRSIICRLDGIIDWLVESYELDDR